MKNLALLFLLAFTVTVRAQDVVASLAPTSGTSESALPSSYTYPDTKVGGTTALTVRIRNGASSPVEILGLVVSDDPSSITGSVHYVISGQATSKVLAANNIISFEDVSVSFSPTSVGVQTGYLRVIYQKQQNGCSFTDASNACVTSTATLSTLAGNATAPDLVLGYGANGATVTPQPNSSTPINFGNVSTSASQVITFTLHNNANAAVTAPAISLQTAVFGSTAFVLDTSQMPPSIAAGQDGTFTVKFAPGQTGLTTATLTVGNGTYGLSGTGIVVASIDALQISYYDSTGVRTLPQAATPIAFDQLTAGAGTSSTLTFTVANPNTSFSSISLSGITVAGSGFSITNLPAMPTAIAPGASITFRVVFAGSSAGNFTGTLSIGTRQFALTGHVIKSPLPDATFSFDQVPTLSQQQVHLTVQLAAASGVSSIGQLTMAFQPSVADISDDPAVQFLATGGRTLQVAVASGDTRATYSGEASIGLQTGTTAGTLTLTLTFPDKAPFAQSFTITPVAPGLSTMTAVRQNPYLVVTVTGFDNSYSMSSMAFTFTDASGKQINATPMTIDVSSLFHNYFFGSTNAAGGAFVVQAKFPVSGDVNQIGSVTAGLSNSSGSSTLSKTFQ